MVALQMIFARMKLMVTLILLFLYKGGYSKFSVKSSFNNVLASLRRFYKIIEVIFNI